MLVMVAATLVLAVGFDLSAIASIGSAVALLIFTLVTIAHLRIRRDTGALLIPLFLGLLTAGVTLVVFITTTLVDDRAASVALVVILLLSVGLDLWWTWARGRRAAVPEAAE
jgi:hypothetical protein